MCRVHLSSTLHFAYPTPNPTYTIPNLHFVYPTPGLPYTSPNLLFIYSTLRLPYTSPNLHLIYPTLHLTNTWSTLRYTSHVPLINWELSYYQATGRVYVYVTCVRVREASHVPYTPELCCQKKTYQNMAIFSKDGCFIKRGLFCTWGFSWMFTWNIYEKLDKTSINQKFSKVSALQNVTCRQ